MKAFLSRIARKGRLCYRRGTGGTYEQQELILCYSREKTRGVLEGRCPFKKKSLGEGAQLKEGAYHALLCFGKTSLERREFFVD